MPRQPRIEFADAHYHVMARGNRQNDIFVDDDDRETFLRTLRQMGEKCDFEVFAWVLMSNHYHLAIRTPKGNLVEGMKWFQNTYTRRFNTRHRSWGRLFGDRYKAVVVDPEGGPYLSSLIDYLHLNPARAGIVRASRGESIVDYPWSSLVRDYIKPPSKRAPYMAGAEGLSVMGHRETAKGRRDLVDRLDERMRMEEAEKCGLSVIDGQSLQSTLRRGWYWGKEEFRGKMLKFAEKKRGRRGIASNRDYASSGLAKQSDEARAEEILQLVAEHFGMDCPSEIRALRKGDRRRVIAAWALWKRTAMRHRWIADQLGYITPANVSQQARRFEAFSDRERTKEERSFVQKLKNVD